MLKKAHNKYHNGAGKEKAAKYYQENKEMIKKEKEKSTNEWIQKKRIK